MNEKDIAKIFELVRGGKLNVADATARLRHMPFEDLGFAKVDHHRALRQGFAEVVLARGKTAKQVAEIVRELLRPAGSKQNVLVTRADRRTFAAVKRVARAAKFHELSGAITIERAHTATHKGLVLVISAGTSDIPVAEEALVTARIMGNRAEEIYDVGVAGLHRLLVHKEKWRKRG